MTEQIVITGVGCVSPLAVGLDATWDALLAGRFVTDAGIAPVDRDGRARVEQLALLAAREAIGGRDLSDAILFVGTSKGAADQWLTDGHVGGYGLDTLSATLARELNVRGERRTFSAACASGMQALAAAAMRMRHEPICRAVIVASESSLHGIWSQTFKRLGVLTKPGEPCRPFDEDRDGFGIGEAAAAVVLERRVPRAGDIVIVDALFGGDAYHLTGTDPDAKLLRHLLHRVAGEGPIDFVHAHATATGNDAIELAAIGAALGRPTVYSHKGAIGHTLGASGLLAIAISTRVHATDTVPPHPTTPRPIGPNVAGREPHAGRPIRSSVAIASGFGGATATVALRRCE